MCLELSERELLLEFDECRRKLKSGQGQCSLCKENKNWISMFGICKDCRVKYCERKQNGKIL